MASQVIWWPIKNAKFYPHHHPACGIGCVVVLIMPNQTAELVYNQLRKFGRNAEGFSGKNAILE